MVKSAIKAVFRKIYKFFTDGIDAEKYRLIAVDESEQKVTLHIKNKSVVLRCNYTEAMDMDIVEGLRPTEACLLGGCFGRAWRASMQDGEKLRKPKHLSFLLKADSGRYKIIFENRSGDIGYIDTIGREEYVEHPTAIVKSDYVVSRFSSSQACYIGFLAGMSIEKKLHQMKNNPEANTQNIDKVTPKLRVVK